MLEAQIPVFWRNHYFWDILQSSKYRLLDQSTKVFLLVKRLILSDAPASSSVAFSEAFGRHVYSGFVRRPVHHLVHLTFPARGFVCFGPLPKMIIWQPAPPRVVKSGFASCEISNNCYFAFWLLSYLKHWHYLLLNCHELQICLHHPGQHHSEQKIDSPVFPRPLLSFRTHSSNQLQFVTASDIYARHNFNLQTTKWGPANVSMAKWIRSPPVKAEDTVWQKWFKKLSAYCEIPPSFYITGQLLIWLVVFVKWWFSFDFTVTLWLLLAQE